MIESENRLKKYCDYDQAKEFLTKNKINGLKYNYSMDDSVQNFNNYQCQIYLQNDSLMIDNLKTSVFSDLDLKYTKSSGSCKLSDIQSFLYGSFSSRFWILRKQINSIPIRDFIAGKVPFYPWQCITIKMKNREVDLVIKDEEHMQSLITFLVYELKTKDGQKDTAISVPVEN